jgi:hypothetical protein
MLNSHNMLYERINNRLGTAGDSRFSGRISTAQSVLSPPAGAAGPGYITLTGSTHSKFDVLALLQTLFIHVTMPQLFFCETPLLLRSLLSECRPRIPNRTLIPI